MTAGVWEPAGRECRQAGMDACGQEEAISEPRHGAAHPPSKRTLAPRFALIWHEGALPYTDWLNSSLYISLIG